MNMRMRIGQSQTISEDTSKRLVKSKSPNYGAGPYHIRFKGMVLEVGRNYVRRLK